MFSPKRLPLRCQDPQPRGARYAVRAPGWDAKQLGSREGQVDFIRSSFRANGREPEIIVHEHCGE
jgi:hypothetical protein